MNGWSYSGSGYQTASTTVGNGSVIYVTLHTGPRRPPEEPPAGACVPAPEPLPPGPLRWTAMRLDLPVEIEA